MLKRFFISFLGALAAIWFSAVISVVLMIVSLGAIVAMGLSSNQSVSVSKHSILHLTLDDAIVDRETMPNFIKEIYNHDTHTIALNDIVKALDCAADDDRIDGVFIDGAAPSVGLANAQEIISALKRFKKSGKWVIAYAENYSQTGYYIGCHADSVLVNPVGMIDIHGLGSMTAYFKTLLDRLGIEIQVVKVGTYKSAVEPFILTESSEANREQQMLFLTNMWDCMKEGIAEARKLKAADVDKLADEVMFALPVEDLKKAGLIDGIKYRHEVEETLCALTEKEDRDDLKLIDVASYCSADKLPEHKELMKVAVYYALGDINDSGEEGIVGETVCSDIFDIIDDEEIDALILRVNSPGGSASASEQIWEALEQFKKRTGKPFYVSMSDYAASGGYYISCGADCIYADDLTLTGSIGVFGMVPNVKKGLNEHLGVNMSVVQTNPNATFPTILAPMTEAQRAAMQAHVNQCYDLFTKRVASGRKMSQDSVKAIAEGRVWDGATALKLGLVDNIGGLDATLAAVAKKLGVEATSLEVEEYPNAGKKWWKELIQFGGIRIKNWMLADELDAESMELLRAVKAVKGMNPVQARMLPLEVK